MKALLDTNIVVDVLQRREPWFQDGAVIFRAIANKQIEGCLTAKQITDIHFFSRKQFKEGENVDVKARQVIEKLLAIFSLIDTLGFDCQKAFGNENGDYEDAVLIESAVRAGADCIVTRNPEHFKTSTVLVYAPDQFVSVISQAE